MARRCHPRRDRVTHAGWQGLIVRLGQSGGDKEQMEWLAADVEPLTCPRPALARLPARLHPPPQLTPIPRGQKGWMCAPWGQCNRRAARLEVMPRRGAGGLLMRARRHHPSSAGLTVRACLCRRKRQVTVRS